MSAQVEILGQELYRVDSARVTLSRGALRGGPRGLAKTVEQVALYLARTGAQPLQITFAKDAGTCLRLVMLMPEAGIATHCDWMARRVPRHAGSQETELASGRFHPFEADLDVRLKETRGARGEISYELVLEGAECSCAELHMRVYSLSIEDSRSVCGY